MADICYRRQFYLGPEHPALLRGWKRLEVGPNQRLTVHPDLDVVQYREAEESLTLLGFALDPDDPESGAQDVAVQLWLLRAQPSELWSRASRLGGRWAIVVRASGRTWVLHDATGARQVSYARLGSTTVCASQPALIAGIHDLAVDAQAQAFVRARGDSDLEVYWLPGDRSLYPQVRVLLPNHRLDLTAGTAERVWPTGQALSSDEPEAIIDRCESTLRSIMKAARRRGSGLAVPMTAGWDSRLALALCRDDAEDLFCYTLTYPNQSRRNPDVAVPARLLRRLGLKHHVVDYPTSIDPVFRDICRRSTWNGHDAFCADSQALGESYPKGRLCVTGDAAEIIKCHYRLDPGEGSDVTPQGLAELCGLPLHPFALDAFRAWLEGVPRDIPMNVLDLFCWEQMVGRWQAMIRADYDIVQDSFAPLNSRSLLIDLLSLPEALRCRPTFLLFGEIVRRLWPDVLSEPINPSQSESVAFRTARHIARLGIQQLLPGAWRGRLRLFANRM